MNDQESVEFGSASNPRWAQTAEAVAEQTFGVWPLWARDVEEWPITKVTDKTIKAVKTGLRRRAECVMSSKTFLRGLTFNCDIAKILAWPLK